MASAPATQQRTDTRQQDQASQVDQILAATRNRFKQINDELLDPKRVKQLEQLLPPQMKGHAERLMRRAILTLNRKKDQYGEVTKESFLRTCLLYTSDAADE